MKKIVSTLILSGFVFLTSCSDWLDLRPESEIVLEDFWQDESEVNEVLAACYRAMIEDGFMERVLVWGELRSDNVVSTGNTDMPTDMWKLINGDISSNNGYVKWGPFYTVINYCNTFLHYAPGVVEKDANFTQSDLNSLKAEVLTIRALSYFYLVRTFKEVPWITEASISDNQDYSLAKSSEEIILDNLIQDLEFAEKYARDQFDTNLLSKGRITKSAVRALLADIYIWKEDYASCVEYCDKVISDSNLELEEGENVLQSVFYSGNSSESIFELQFDEDIQNNNIVDKYYGTYSDPIGYWAFPYVLINGNYRIFNLTTASGTESEDDLRRYDFLINVLSENYNIFKYVGALRQEVRENVFGYVYGSSTSNWIVYRLSDIMLLKAEALVQLENYKEALKLVNTTYLRSNISTGQDSLLLTTYNTQKEMQDLVLRERQRELMFEGKRWFDLMRLARRENSPEELSNYVIRKYSSSGTQNLKLSVMDALYLPIHIDEFNSNPKLEQNPFYEIESGSITK
ncbi:RagB/SusD family nutrient uptake outer membrane protein [Geofilum sp. OHC36d9]|uniref:RagB/SusD family nutrient uptake outer membrane protein n=1 Tax=Geofilum sp. OHC36d9 TaxID=3458413 RepID=UPI0040339E09